MIGKHKPFKQERKGIIILKPPERWRVQRDCAEKLQYITPHIIPTYFGDVYALTAGASGQPLIMVVHVSGPKNSADQYAFLLCEYLLRIQYIEKFYLVVIDCPGYGKSKDSKQASTLFLFVFFKTSFNHLIIVHTSMLGHSKGGAAIFNAVFEEPLITILDDGTEGQRRNSIEKLTHS